MYRNAAVVLMKFYDPNIEMWIGGEAGFFQMDNGNHGKLILLVPNIHIHHLPTHAPMNIVLKEQAYTLWI